ncbi:MAG: T9SS type A sorting domain-containing protein [Melioribacteraceae bacterium]
MKKLKLLFFSLCFLPFLIFGQNVLTNPGFEDGVDSKGIPNGWIGYAQTGASMQVMNEPAKAHSGNYWVKCTTTQGAQYLLYQNTFPAKEGDVWKFSSFIKDVSATNPGTAVFAALKISAKSSTGATFKYWEIHQDSITSNWKEFATTQTLPAGTAFIQAVFVIDGATGAPEASYGIDDVKLEKIKSYPVSTLPNYLPNPSFEDGVDAKGIPNGWIGYAQAGASMTVVKDNATAYNGDYWTKCTSTQGGYYLLYQKTYASKEGDVWDFSSFIKDVSPKYPGASYVALKISAKSVTGATFLAWEIFQDSVTTYWRKFSNRQTMPEGTASIQAVIVVHGADGALEASYGFDDVRLELVSSIADKTNLLANPGFEEGADDKGIPKSWIGYAQTGASLEFKSDASTAHSGVNWVKCTSTQGGYYLLYQNSFPAKPGQVWELSSYFKDISPSYPGANFAALKISAKSVTGSTFLYWEIFPEKVTTEWAKYTNTQTMPEGTAYLQAVVVIHGADGAPEAAYGIDDVKLALITDVGVEEINTIPTKFELSQNYPNPFNPTTVLQYSLPKEGNVSLKVYNVIGQEVATLVNAHQKIGNYKVNFNAEHLASGIYFYRIQAGSFSEVKKMLLIK